MDPSALCGTDTSFDSNTEKCVSSVDPSALCGRGTTFDSNTEKCVSSINPKQVAKLSIASIDPGSFCGTDTVLDRKTRKCVSSVDPKEIVESYKEMNATDKISQYMDSLYDNESFLMFKNRPCEDSAYISESHVGNVSECNKKCRNEPRCAAFTVFHHANDLCRLFSKCDNPYNESETTTGKRNY